MSEVAREADGVVRITLTPPIDRPTMKALLPAYLASLAAEPRPRLLVVMPQVTWPSLGAVWTELPYLPRIWRALKRIDRIALVSDTDGVRTAGATKSRLLRHAELRFFASDDLTAARFWLVGAG